MRMSARNRATSFSPGAPGTRLGFLESILVSARVSSTASARLAPELTGLPSRLLRALLRFRRGRFLGSGFFHGLFSGRFFRRSFFGRCLPWRGFLCLGLLCRRRVRLGRCVRWSVSWSVRRFVHRRRFRGSVRSRWLFLRQCRFYF